jgi:hypothetical protein
MAIDLDFTRSIYKAFTAIYFWSLRLPRRAGVSDCSVRRVDD